MARELVGYRTNKRGRRVPIYKHTPGELTKPRVITGYKTNKRGRKVPIYGNSGETDTVTKSNEKIIPARNVGNIDRRIPSTPASDPVAPKVLRYPLDTITSSQDFIRFTSLVYKRDKGAKGGPAGSKNTKTTGTTILPIPSQLLDSNKANYGESRMNDLVAQGITDISKTIGSASAGEFTQNLGAMTENVAKTAADNKDVISGFMASKAISALGGNVDMNQLLGRTQGVIINPNVEMLFNGPALRSFKFQFKFTPRYEGESVEIRNIIKFFKLNMAPKGGSGFTLKNPNIFEVAYQGECVNYLHKFKLCALSDMSINYTGEGNYATYEGGAPISMLMDLSFTALTPVYQEDYGEWPYGSMGVGY